MRVLVLALLYASIGVSHLAAQRVRLGDSFVIPDGQVAPPSIGVNPPPATQFGSPQPLTLPQVTINPTPSPQATGQPVLPTLQSPYPPAGTVPVLGPQPTGVTGTVPTMPPGLPPQSVQPPQFIYPPPGQPVVGTPYMQPTGTTWADIQFQEVYRLFQGPRWRQTYISRSGAKGMGVNETDLATTLNFPNFLYSGQPLRVSPGFIFHFWDGPSTPETGADFPGQTYSVYVATDFATPWDRPYGGEVNVTVGLYSDFEEVTSNSVRVTGVGVGWFRLNNTTTLKAGIEYLDRVNVKLLPAIGLFVYPNPNTKLDIYFPRPKLSRRFQSVGGYDVWGYIGGEYGGGSWTFKRLAGMGDQADVNDIRLFLGLEWAAANRAAGFIEAGYVFEREIVYRSNQDANIDIDDAAMVRAGIAF